MTSNGTSHPFNATLEQNIIALSKIFDNITFQKVSNLLNTNVEMVEKTASNMIHQGSLKAAIDQAHSLIYFQSKSPSFVSLISRYNLSESEDVVSVDQQFLRACQESNSIFNRIASDYPEWYAKKFPESASQ